MDNFLTIILVLLAVSAMVLQDVFKKICKQESPVFLAFVSAFFALILFICLSGFRIRWDDRVIWYAVGFGISYSLCICFSVLALRFGSLSLTGLVISFSLLIPTLYGVLALHNPVGVPFWIGLGLLIASLILINRREKTLHKKEKQFNVRWLVCVLIAFIANGSCSVIQTAQQTVCAGEGKFALMISALFLASLILLVLSLFTEREKIKIGFKRTLLCGGGAGLANGGLNFLVLLLMGKMPAAVMFPLISGGSLLLTFLLARLLFKEKYRKLQYIGFALGLVAVVLLNI